MTSRLLTLHHPAAARAYYESGLWRADTFYSLLRDNAETRAERCALRDGTRRVTWSELVRRVDALAADLNAAGLAEGDRVALWLSNRVEAVTAFLACARQGYVCNPSLHRNYTCEEILAILERTQAAALVAEEGHGARGAADPDGVAIFAAAERLDHMQRVYRLRSERSDDGLPVSAPGAPLRADDPDIVCYLAFTSGTTGDPKGVMHSANTLLANARDLVRDWNHDSQTVLLTLSPLSHHIAWVAVAQWLLMGGELVVDDPPEGTSRLDWVVETGATYVMGVPTHAIDILAEQRRQRLARLGAVSVFYMAGAPIPPATAQAFLEQNIKPQNVYGMTENSSHQYTHPGDDAETIVTTCGPGGPAYEVRIFSSENSDAELPPGEMGEIGGRGAALMLGYFDNQNSTEQSFNREGWFLSGDLGRLDEAGCLHVIGRLKDLIIRGGHNIYPARIEELALTHPGVGKAAAFAVADERLGERVCLAVMTTADPAPQAGEVLQHLYEAGLSKLDMPEYYVVLPEFPLTASGKILKRELAAWVPAGRLTPQPVRFRIPDAATGG